MNKIAGAALETAPSPLKTKNALLGKHPPVSFNIRQLATTALALGALTAVSGAHAAFISDCPISAIVCYEYDDAQGAVVLMGTPTRVGNDMEFLPPAFIAESNGTGFVTATANFIFSRVWTPGGQEITGLEVFEEGDYEIINGGDVRATLYMQARSNLLSSDSISTLISQPYVGDSGGPQIWDLTGSLAPATFFTAMANDMRVTIQDTLRANSAAGQYAFIQKKFTLTTTTTVVPMPAAVWLLGSALGLLGVVRRRAAATA